MTDPMTNLDTRLEPLAIRFQQEAEKVVGNPDYSDEYKARTVGDLQANILTEMEASRAAYYSEMEASRTALLSKAQLAPPTPETAAQFLYMRDALIARWGSQDAKSIFADFEKAIQAGNPIEIRVFYDFASTAPAFQAKLSHSDKMQHAVTNIKLTELRKAAEEKLLGPDGVKARARLAEVEGLLSETHRKRMPQSMMLVKHSSYRGGKLTYSQGRILGTARY